MVTMRILAGYRDLMREGDEAWIAWNTVLRGAWIGLVVLSLPLLIWSGQWQSPSRSALEVFVRSEPPVSTFF